METLKKIWIGRIATRWCIILILSGAAYYLILPRQLFHDPYSTVLRDASGELLSAAIAADGQWRFPQSYNVPDKFAKALIAYEDKNFYEHPGIDVLAFGRAMRQNIRAGRIISGGSTISMQVVRLSRKGRPRNVFQKTVEMALATRLEWRYSKKEILSLYTSHAPFGGNVVGLEAACWRYFGRESSAMSWSEAALLAVLPNSPGMIHPGRNRERLKTKRNRLLDKLQHTGVIDEVTCALAKDELLPDAPRPLPRLAKHLLSRAAKEGYSGQVVNTTLDLSLQHRIEQIVREHHQRLSGNQIFNASAIVLDVRSGNVLVYVGNTGDDPAHNNAVDIVTARRSTGSILKPFLYAAMLDEGKILPRTLLPDVPTIINGFAPKNFSREYDGAVHADEAVIRSLNIPAVHLLKRYRYEKFHTLLRNVGMKSLDMPADHYGLAMVLGGAEGTLWDITGMYASMARSLNNYFDHPGRNRYQRSDYHAPRYLKADAGPAANIPDLDGSSWLGAAAIYQTFEALTEVYRPGEASGWKHFASSHKVAWKTGTSFGFRDGWAIGVTPDHVVGVWVGNADGEGRPGLTGTDAAAPLMFDIFSQLDGKGWFRKPIMEMERISVCTQSGQRNTLNCPQTDSLWVIRAGLESLPCSYHKRIYVSSDERSRVHAGCMQPERMKEISWFVLPPVQEHYFKVKHVSFRPLPPFRDGCEVSSALTPMDLIYPRQGSSIFIPRELDGRSGQAVFELAHHNPGMTVHWHLDGAYLGSTQRRHFLPVNPAAGKHKLVLVDENGEEISANFEVVNSM